MKKSRNKRIKLLTVGMVLILLLLITIALVIYIIKGPSHDRILRSRQEVKETIYQELAAYKGEFVIHVPSKASMTHEDVDSLFAEIHKEHPEMFWLNGECEYDVTNTKSRSMEITLKPGVTCEIDHAADMNDALQSMFRLIASEAKEAGSSDYEQVKYVHDQLIGMCEYSNDKEDPLRNTSYGCIFNGKASGEGYARAFQSILQNLDIECGFISGQGTKSSLKSNYGWNYVKIDNDYYQVDVSLDDLNSDDGISYSNFCKSEKTMSATHTPDEGQEIPECTKDRKE